MLKKTFTLYVIITFITLFEIVFAFGKGEEIYKEYVVNFIEIVKNDDKTKIAKIVNYPIARKYPLPPIQNEKDFIDRFDEVFDKKLKNLIINSDAEKDWGMVGWRGIIFQQGLLWLDYNGKLISINYMSDKEQKHYNNIVNNDKKNIYDSLKDYEKIVGEYETKNYKIRIDKTDNSGYRYASWERNKSTSTKPNIVINNCGINYDGSGGNHSYICKNEDYYYIVGINRIGTSETPPADLTIYKIVTDYLNIEWTPSYLPNNAKIILYQPAKILNYEKHLHFEIQKYNPQTEKHDYINPQLSENNIGNYKYLKDTPYQQSLIKK
ncbi:MAG: hypothetical protein Ta2D_10680 [Rickettsiales bacterium]|nr:MAG: hypothetical protein Ta2D_10680 [Rickettsiales bacterium]